MKEIDLQLNVEANCFVNYLVQRNASSNLTKRYASALKILKLDKLHRKSDWYIFQLARIHPLLTSMLDGASSLIDRHSLLRKRLFVMTALIETEPTYADFYLSESYPSPIFVLIRITWSFVQLVISLLFGLPLVFTIKRFSKH